MFVLLYKVEQINKLPVETSKSHGWGHLGEISLIWSLTTHLLVDITCWPNFMDGAFSVIWIEYIDYNTSSNLPFTHNLSPKFVPTYISQVWLVPIIGYNKPTVPQDNFHMARGVGHRVWSSDGHHFTSLNDWAPLVPDGILCGLWASDIIRRPFYIWHHPSLETSINKQLGPHIHSELSNFELFQQVNSLKHQTESME